MKFTNLLAGMTPPNLPLPREGQFLSLDNSSCAAPLRVHTVEGENGGSMFRIMNIFLITLLVVLLTACASSPERKSKKSKQDEDINFTPGVSILPAGPATPNPYLQNPTNVSKAIASQFAAAQQAMRNQQWEKAENLLLQIIASNDKLSGAHVNLANVYAAQKQKDQAETSYQMAIVANPKNLDAYNQFAIFKREAGEFSEAEKLYRQAITIWPFHAASHKNIAILYDLYIGKPEQALPHYEAYMQLVGEDKQAASWIADLQRRLGIQPKPKAAPAAETTEVVEEASTESETESTTETTDAVEAEVTE